MADVSTLASAILACVESPAASRRNASSPSMQSRRQLLAPGAMAPRRCGIRGRDGEVEAGGRYGRIQQVRRALYAGGEPARRKLRVHVEIAGRPPAERDAGVPGTLLDI